MPCGTFHNFAELDDSLFYRLYVLMTVQKKMQFEESNLSKMLQCMLDSCVFSGGPVVVFPVSLQKSSAFGEKKKRSFFFCSLTFSVLFLHRRGFIGVGGNTNSH